MAPTIGFSSVDFRFDKYNVKLFDLGGGKKIRGIWKNYFSEVYGVIYVIDSSEPERIEECASVLQGLVEHPKVAGKPLLVLVVHKLMIVYICIAYWSSGYIKLTF